MSCLLKMNIYKITNPIPKKVYTVVEQFDRNSDVIAEVLLRANGICECCKNLHLLLGQRMVPLI